MDTRTSKPPDGGRTKADRSRAVLMASLEVGLVVAFYIGVSHLLVRSFELGGLLPAALGARERSVGGVFLLGALTQIAIVLAFLGLRQPDFVEAARQTVRPATRQGWIVAGLATAIHVATAVAFFVPSAADVLELSVRNALLSLAAAPDGWSQEMVFRGYLLFRLERSGIPTRLRIGASGVAFSAIHLGYAGSDFASAFWPLTGTFVLGAFYAWSVTLAGRSLKPVVVCHVLIIVLVQPWLAMG